MVIHCQPQATQKNWRSAELIVVNEGVGHDDEDFRDTMMMMVANRISCSMAVHVTASHLFKTSLLFLASL